MLCRCGNLKEIGDGKVARRKSLARQHWVLVCRMTPGMRKTKRAEVEQKIKWWKLKKEDPCEDFQERLRKVLGTRGELPDDWVTTATIKETGRGGVWCVV